MSNINDVAALAGVSVATVSRFLRTPEKVASKSAVRVAEAIDQLNYTPNLLARSFSERRSYTLLVLMPALASPFLAQLVLGVEEVGMEAGYRIILGEARNNDGNLKAYLEMPASGAVDGVIQLLNSPSDDIKERQKISPVVIACDCEDDLPCPTVAIDDELAARQMTEHLLSLGHKRIACVSGPSYVVCCGKRLQGFRQALQAHGVAYHPELHVECDFTADDGASAAQQLNSLPEPPTAYLCMSDCMAMGVIHGLKQQGLRVPQDASVVGFDDIDLARFTDPPLTTVRQPTAEMGKLAARIVLDKLRNPNGLDQDAVLHHRLPHELILRASTGPVPSA